MGILVGILAAGFFGSGDFLGGRASRDAPTPVVTVIVAPPPRSGPASP